MKRVSTLLLLLLTALVAFGLTACRPTGHTACDSYWPPLAVMETQTNYNMDCSPSFEGRKNNGALTTAYVDHGDRMIYVWPDRMSYASLRKTMWHEVAHAKGISSEHHADAYAYCHMAPHEREGVSFIAPLPGSEDCRRLG